METRIYDYLHKDAEEIRRRVFVEEQKFTEEFDDIDDMATHLVMYDKSLPVAVCRLFSKDEPQVYVLGRIAVIPSYRKSGTGRRLVQEAESTIKKLGGRKIVLSAQVRAVGFYEKLGYSGGGEAYLEEYCPHVKMSKEI